MNITRMYKFLIAGGSAAAFEYLIFVILQSQLDASWIIFSQTVSFLCGFVVSFMLNKKWVFKSDGNSKQELVRYAILAAINLVLSNIVLWFLVSTLGVLFWIAKFIVMAMVATWNYLIFQKIIFKTN